MLIEDVTAQSSGKSTPLHLALKDGNVDSAQLLVERCADVNSQDYSKATPLHLRCRHVGFARVLIEHGADVNSQDNSESTPLHLALTDGHVGLAQVLVEYGADVNAQDCSKSTSLHLALSGGHIVRKGSALASNPVYFGGLLEPRPPPGAVFPRLKPGQGVAKASGTNAPRVTQRTTANEPHH